MRPVWLYGCITCVCVLSIHLECWLDLQQYRRTAQKNQAARQERASHIASKYLDRKYFFGPDSPATQRQQNHVGLNTLCSVLSPLYDVELLSKRERESWRHSQLRLGVPSPPQQPDLASCRRRADSPDSRVSLGTQGHGWN